MKFSIIFCMGFLASLLILSCSSGPKVNNLQWSHQAVTQGNDPQLLDRQKQWEHFELGQGIPNAPYYFISPDALKDTKSSKNTRSLSSSTSSAVVKRPLQTIGDKGIYFLIYYEQYESYRKLVGGLDRIDSCPNFHSALLEYFPLNRGEEQNSPLDPYQLPWEKLKNLPASTWAFFPELSLPLQNQSPFPSLIEIFQNQVQNSESELLTRALLLHGKMMKAELDELCENGSTENSYVFENTDTYLKDHADKLSQDEHLKILNRINLFSNLTLIKVLQEAVPNQRRPSSVQAMRNNFEAELLERMHATWATKYWDNLLTMRKKFL